MSDLVTSHFKSKEYSSDTAKCESVSFARTYSMPALPKHIANANLTFRSS